MAGAKRAWRKENKSKIAASNAKRRAEKLRATPSWVDLKTIEAFYVEAQRLSKQTGLKHHVDHTVPLKGKGVCGLHVPWNLQVIPAVENMRKGNKFQGMAT
jgi:hypothetical protein